MNRSVESERRRHELPSLPQFFDEAASRGRETTCCSNIFYHNVSHATSVVTRTKSSLLLRAVVCCLPVVLVDAANMPPKVANGAPAKDLQAGSPNQT
jgi:hypothetical protein